MRKELERLLNEVDKYVERRHNLRRHYKWKEVKYKKYDDTEVVSIIKILRYKVKQIDAVIKNNEIFCYNYKVYDKRNDIEKVTIINKYKEIIKEYER